MGHSGVNSLTRCNLFCHPRAHVSHCLCIASRVLQFSSVLFPYAKLFASSTNPMALVFLPGRSHISNRSAL